MSLRLKISNRNFTDFFTLKIFKDTIFDTSHSLRLCLIILAIIEYILCIYVVKKLNPLKIWPFLCGGHLCEKQSFLNEA